jgi:hypothetical protein
VRWVGLVRVRVRVVLGYELCRTELWWIIYEIKLFYLANLALGNLNFSFQYQYSVSVDEIVCRQTSFVVLEMILNMGDALNGCVRKLIPNRWMIWCMAYYLWVFNNGVTRETVSISLHIYIHASSTKPSILNLHLKAYITLNSDCRTLKTSPT